MFFPATNKNNKMLQRCVSDAAKNAGTQMAQAKRASKLFGAVTGAALAVSAAVTPFAAAAQDVTPVSQIPSADAVWTDELRELDQQSTLARQYSMQNPNAVGILLHLGDGFRERAKQIAKEHNVPDEKLDILMERMIARIEKSYAEPFAKYGVTAKVFPRHNIDGQATLVTYHIDDIVYEDATGDALLGMTTARKEIPRVVEALRVAKQVAQLDADQPAIPSLDGS